MFIVLILQDWFLTALCWNNFKRASEKDASNGSSASKSPQELATHGISNATVRVEGNTMKQKSKAKHAVTSGATEAVLPPDDPSQTGPVFDPHTLPAASAGGINSTVLVAMRMSVDGALNFRIADLDAIELHSVLQEVPKYILALHSARSRIAHAANVKALALPVVVAITAGEIVPLLNFEWVVLRHVEHRIEGQR
ncbi:MAG: hypothetical protein IPJ08_07655 [Burkholderiales bacterium]|nr:hypothetical protein [Burkholderiales bacterium]